MPITMPTTAVEGIQLTVIPLRPDAAIGTMELPTLLQLEHSPKAEEDKRALKYASGTLRRHAEVRGLVQRMLKASQIAKSWPILRDLHPLHHSRRRLPRLPGRRARPGLQRGFAGPRAAPVVPLDALCGPLAERAEF
jgi:hypothetical protein